ncbi:hypothetical protein U1Q18_030784 [Sarracenia purpurea var. burkii]
MRRRELRFPTRASGQANSAMLGSGRRRTELNPRWRRRRRWCCGQGQGTYTLNFGFALAVPVVDERPLELVEGDGAVEG